MRGVGLVRQGQPVAAFLLHDGECQARTDQLHEFMESVPHLEWEGWEGGITIWRDEFDQGEDGDPLDVSPGQWIVLVDGRLRAMDEQCLLGWLREPAS